MAELRNLALLLGDAVVYFTALALLLRWREKLGIGAFFCALGVMHFLETYLASIFYISLPFGIVTSPGSSALFAGKLMMLLLIYIREDAALVRQPIYGLLFGNLLLAAMALMMRQHILVPLGGDRVADLGFLDQMGLLMVWGTLILFVDSIMIIVLYERLRGWFGRQSAVQVTARLWACAAIVLSFDQVAFFAGLHVLTGAPVSVLVGGWATKMVAAALYALLGSLYLNVIERPSRRRANVPRIADVFDVLTYRERYHDLLARTGRDALTGAFDRNRLEAEGRRLVETAIDTHRPVSLLIVDIDHFKGFNDRFGHAEGDAVLKRIAHDILGSVRAGDQVFRYGGEEFVVLCAEVGADAALTLGERIRREVASRADMAAPRVTVSIGVATANGDVHDYDTLFALADARLYRAKAAGRNCVIGERVGGTETPARLVVA
jgi:diguanylate cyclase (GGDEF)-like protein